MEVERREPKHIILQLDQAIPHFMTEQENGNDRDKFNSSIPLLKLGAQATSQRAKGAERNAHGPGR